MEDPFEDQQQVQHHRDYSTLPRRQTVLRNSKESLDINHEQPHEEQPHRCHLHDQQTSRHQRSEHSHHHQSRSFKPHNQHSYSQAHPYDHHHHHHHHRSHAFTMLYAIFVTLLLLWLLLQYNLLTYDNNHNHTLPNQQLFFTLLSDLKTELKTASMEAPTSNASSNVSNNEDDAYIVIFYVLLSVNCFALIPFWCKYCCVNRRYDLGKFRRQHQQQNQQHHQRQHQQHRRLLYQIYLPPYLLATSADWIQGPYKYALYSSYGYTQRDIATLFVAGYGSGMTLGSMVGGLADSYGRKRFCLLYCVSYMASVLAKHCRLFVVLLVGRVAGGVATSLLFSVFESWLIKAHSTRDIVYEGSLASSLSVSMYGSSAMAIVSGVIANLVVEWSGKMRPVGSLGSLGSFWANNGVWWKQLWSGVNGTISATNPSNFVYSVNTGNETIVTTSTIVSSPKQPNFYLGGYISAFDFALLPLTLCAILITCLWDENYGDKHDAVTNIDGNHPSSKCTSSSTTTTTPSPLSFHKDPATSKTKTKKRDSFIIREDDSWKDEDAPRIQMLESQSTHQETTIVSKLITSSTFHNKSSSSTKTASQTPQSFQTHTCHSSSSSFSTPASLPSTITSSSSTSKTKLFGALRDASYTVWHTPDILMCCIISSFFEGAMYVFIFMWTPALTFIQGELHRQFESYEMNDYNYNHFRSYRNSSHIENSDNTYMGLYNASTGTHLDTYSDLHPDTHDELPFGWIFSSFMVCCMLGTTTFSHLSNAGVSASKILGGILALSSLSCLAMASSYIPSLGLMGHIGHYHFNHLDHMNHLNRALPTFASSAAVVPGINDTISIRYNAHFKNNHIDNEVNNNITNNIESNNRVVYTYDAHRDSYRNRSSANTPQFYGMLLYEFCIGAYYPAMGVVKGTIVPEHQRAAIYNVFRLPLNFIVLVNLAINPSHGMSFYGNAFLLGIACFLQCRLIGKGKRSGRVDKHGEKDSMGDSTRSSSFSKRYDGREDEENNENEGRI